MNSNVMEPTVADVLREALAAADDGSFVVAPDVETVKRLIQIVDNASPSVHLLAEPAALKAVMDEFLLASRAADHVEAGILDIRSYEEVTNVLVVTDEAVVAVVRADEHVAGLTTNDGAFVESANARFAEAWRNAAPYALKTPPLSTVRETLETELGARTAEDFDTMLAALDADGGAAIDEVTVSLLVAARNEALLYDISKWGEDVGIASKATFSRTKTRLEEQGLIETEKVPIDVGRPRLRLKLGDERLRNLDAEEFARVARSMLAT